MIPDPPEGLPDDLVEHAKHPFPISLDRRVYGIVDPECVESDIIHFVGLEPDNVIGMRALRVVSDNLAKSIDEFPAEAVPYFQRLLRIARRKLADTQY